MKFEHNQFKLRRLRRTNRSVFFLYNKDNKIYSRLHLKRQLTNKKSGTWKCCRLVNLTRHLHICLPFLLRVHQKSYKPHKHKFITRPYCALKRTCAISVGRIDVCKCASALPGGNLLQIMKYVLLFLETLGYSLFCIFI